jgi:hypothetical protein
VSLGGIALAALVALVPAVALADAPPTDIGAPTSLTIDLIGKIPSKCGFSSAPPASVALGDLSHAGSVAIGFALSCNSTFAVRVSSEHGALQFADASVAANADHAISLDYDIALAFTTDLGAIGDHCAASTLSSAGHCSLYGTAAGEGLSSGDGVCFGDTGSLTLSWAAPVKQLVAGQYQDSITITVEPRT